MSRCFLGKGTGAQNSSKCIGVGLCRALVISLIELEYSYVREWEMKLERSVGDDCEDLRGHKEFGLHRVGSLGVDIASLDGC